MNERGSRRPMRGEGTRFAPAEVMKAPHARVMPRMVIEVGELLGLIYRSAQAQPGCPRAYIHLMQDPPHLACNVAGTQLYIVGGSYRVTPHGIEG
jgi:hypothetical protein